MGKTSAETSEARTVCRFGRGRARGVIRAARLCFSRSGVASAAFPAEFLASHRLDLHPGPAVPSSLRSEMLAALRLSRLVPERVFLGGGGYTHTRPPKLRPLPPRCFFLFLCGRTGMKDFYTGFGGGRGVETAVTGAGSWGGGGGHQLFVSVKAASLLLSTDR